LVEEQVKVGIKDPASTSGRGFIDANNTGEELEDRAELEREKAENERMKMEAEIRRKFLEALRDINPSAL